MTSMTEIFEQIYQDKAWVTKHHNPTSLSGPGSFPTSTVEYHKFLSEFINKNHINSVVDYGCGDSGVYDNFDWGNVSYTGIDVSQTAINLARTRHPNKTFVCTETFDVSSADLLIVKDVFGHWSGERSTQGLGNQLHRITEFLNLNHKKFRCVLIVDGGDLSEYFPEDFAFYIKNLKFNKKLKTIHIKESK
jgi:SAM-dependent methyltransferase